MKRFVDIAIGLLFGLLASGVLTLVAAPPRGQPVMLLPPPTPRPIAVHVTGAVPRPGVYELAPGSRVSDALRAAGGLSPNADPAALNQAALLQDGQQLVVPERAVPSVIRVGAPGGVVLVDINKATAAELDELPGIGPTTAARIIEWREANGPFKSVDDLVEVPGIGPATLEKIRTFITVGNP